MIRHKHRKWAALGAAFTAATLVACNAASYRDSGANATFADKAGHGRFAFELWEEKLVGGLGCHTIIVVQDRATDKALMMQGLATNRDTGAVRPIGVPWKDNIFVWYRSSNLQSLQADKTLERKASLYQTDDKNDMLARLALMMRAGEQINRKQSPYDVTSRIWHNSNATATTLAEAGGLHIGDVRVDGLAPGLGRAIPITYDGPRRLDETKQFFSALPSDQAASVVADQANYLSGARPGENAPYAKEIAYSANNGLGDTVGLWDFLKSALNRAVPAKPAAPQPSQASPKP